MKKISIFHFNPLELYPPVMNMLEFLGNELPENYSIRVYSTTSKKNLKLFESNNKRITIRRFGKYANVMSSIRRLQLYLTYNILSFADAFIRNTSKVFYYETTSALPAFLLKKLKPSTLLFIHYHEYMTPEEYKKIGLLGRLLFFERKIYSKAYWISHTNRIRLDSFIKDEGITNYNSLHVMPNYPSRQWGRLLDKKALAIPLKIVHVGAIGLDGFYFKEFANWVEQQNGKVHWDIYTQHDDTELKDYLKSIYSKYIHVQGFIPYHDIPMVLGQYDVGVILYKGTSPNIVYAEPNKLFEYLACGLDVWVSQDIKGVLPYVKTDSYPKVISMSIKDANFKVEKLIDREQIPFVPTKYYYEEQYKTIRSLLLQ